MNQPPPEKNNAPAICDTAFPLWWEGLLLGALGLDRAGTTAPAFLDALRFFNTQWVGGEGVDYTDRRADLRAYACFYMPANMPKLWMMLDRTPGLAAALGAKPWRIREIGCGPGTFLWAALLWLEQRAPDALRNLTGITGVDRHPGFLTIARRIAAAVTSRPAFRHIRAEFIEADWHDAPPAADEFAIFGNVLNEATAEEAARIAALPAAAIAVIEPGTLKTFHRLLPLRDALAKAGRPVIFPCPPTGERASCPAHGTPGVPPGTKCSPPHRHTDTPPHQFPPSLPPCPMPADNWCHFAVNRFRLPLVQSMAAKAGRLNPRHNFCGFLFGKPGVTPAAGPAAGAVCWRTLSHLRKSNRSGVRWLCSGACLREIVLGRRDRNDGNRAFLDAEWGDLLEISPGPGRNNPAKTARLAESDTVAVTDPTDPTDRSDRPHHPAG